MNLMRFGLPLFEFDKTIDLIANILYPKEFAIQTYSNFQSFNPRNFSRYKTPVSNNLSSLSKLAFKKYPNFRFLSPTHSFVVFNAKTNLYDHIFSSAFGSESIFSFFFENDYYWLNIGCHLNETCTFLHYVESMNHELINYRKNVTFPVEVFKYKNQDVNILINYEYFSRIKEVNSKHSWVPIENSYDLRDCLIKQSPITSIYNLRKIFDVATKLIKNYPSVFLVS